MANKLYVQPLGRLARFADKTMIPLMYLVSGTTESPQRTHFWNNTKLKSHEVESLKTKDMVNCERVCGSNVRFWFKIPLFHISILGGWKRYIVLEPSEPNQKWHVGWIANDIAGVSRIKLNGPVRLLLGPENVSFFGISANENLQIVIRRMGTGRIGDGGPYSREPLL